MRQEIKLDKNIELFLKEHGNIYIENDFPSGYQESYYTFPRTIFLFEELLNKWYIITENNIPKDLVK